MVHDKSVPLESIIKAILDRVQPVEGRRNLESFLTNVTLFIKRMEGAKLTEAEKNYPEHPQFAHYLLDRGSETVNGLRRRLEIIDRYQIDDAQRIMNIILAASASPVKRQLTARQIQILLELYQNPFIQQYKLAIQLNTTSRTISQELQKLRNQADLSIVHNIDFHKFRLAQFLTYFRTKSLKASERLDKFYQRNTPSFALRLDFDQDYRQGIILYAIPDQPRAYRFFEERNNWLRDEFFEESYQKRVLGYHVALSFDGYESRTGTWMLKPDIISEVMLRFEKRHRKERAPSKGIFYSIPMRFDKVDYLLANTSFGSGRIGRFKLKQNLLRRFGIDLTPKTLWNRERRLQKEAVFFPVIYFKIPEYEEIVSFHIECTPDTIEPLRFLPSILPYSFILTIENGIVFAFQRPAQCSAIIGQLVRTINQQKGVSKVDVLRLEPTLFPLRAAHNVNRWDESRQRWIIKEGDI